MKILGLSCFYHDSAATLVIDGKVVAASMEERFTRKKHDPNFPKNAIDFCLKSQDLNISDIDYIAFYEKPILKFERILTQHLEAFPKSYVNFLKTIPIWIKEKLRLKKQLKKIGYKKEVLYINHHLSHAASAFFPSNFKKSTILTLDGVGEWATTTYSIGENNEINLKKEINFPNSLGLLYSTITTYLGFNANNSEYKVMGLAAYGNQNKKTNKFYRKLKKIITINEDSSYSLNQEFFSYSYGNKMFSKNLINLLNVNPRKNSEKINKNHKDLAAALQLTLEEIVINMLNNLDKTDNLVLAGGVALNSVLNSKILDKTNFKNLWIQPASSDAGCSLGAALYTYTKLTNKRNYEMKHDFLGPNYSNEKIKSFLDKNKISYKKLDNKKLIKETAKLIKENKIIGWFQGSMEFGPRALGNRSILANPLNPDMQNILNEKIKKRESFRPFAPAICNEDLKEFFEINKKQKSTDFMLIIHQLKKKWHKKLSSIKHIDNSSRVQTVHKKTNKLFYNLIKEFGKISKIPMLINTSFNINNEPIVCSPEDAYKTFINTKLDALIMGNFLIIKDQNIKIK